MSKRGNGCGSGIRVNIRTRIKVGSLSHLSCFFLRGTKLGLEVGELCGSNR
jgi:hypothetical protein